VTTLTALLLSPLLLMVAFAVDLNHVWRTDAELQNAADAAALAGASRLASSAQAIDPNGALASLLPDLTATARGNVVATARAFVQMHQAGGVSLVVNDSDIELGYVADPSAPSSSPQGQFQTGLSLFPNAVRVTVRRDASVSTGPLPLFFGGLFGVPTSSRQASAVASLRSQGITGFNGSGSRLLPLAIDLNTYNALRGVGAPPPGVTLQDQYTVRSPLESGLTPPANVQWGADGSPEAKVYPLMTTPGNFGLVSLSNGKTTTETTFDNWIVNGPSGADLASLGSLGLQATALSPRTLSGGPGLKASLDAAFQSIIGQPRVVMIYSSFSGTGSNAQCQVVGFAGVTVVASDLSNPTNPSVTVQLSAVIDATATATAGTTGSGRLVYRGVALSQ
jgi:Flp pilus assembly protein TadG